MSAVYQRLLQRRSDTQLPSHTPGRANTPGTSDDGPAPNYGANDGAAPDRRRRNLRPPFELQTGRSPPAVMPDLRGEEELPEMGWRAARPELSGNVPLSGRSRVTRRSSAGRGRQSRATRLIWAARRAAVGRERAAVEGSGREMKPRRERG